MEISVLHKAAVTCVRCRAHKQRCDRNVPHCGRCASKLRRCEYPTTFSTEQSHFPGSSETLLQTFKADDQPNSSNERAARFQRLIFTLEQPSIPLSRCLATLMSQILLESDLTAAQIMDRYSYTVHHWFPVVDLSQLREDFILPANLEAVDTCTLSSMLIMWLHLRTSPSGDTDTAKPIQVYWALKKVVSALELSKQEFCPNLWQLQALIALYECTMGRYYQARLTLSSAIGMVDLRQAKEMEWQFILQRCTCLVILDRTLMLASVDHDVASLCPPSSFICKATQLSLEQKPTPNNLVIGTGPTNSMQIMSRVALAAGRVLHFVYCIRNALRSEETYEDLESCIHDITKSLIEAKGSHSLMYCDAVSLSLCCLVVLHQSRTDQVNALLGTRDYMAIQSSGRLLWDTFKVSSDTLMTVDIYGVSFFSMFYQLRGVHAMQKGSPYQVAREDQKAVLNTLRQLSQRWPMEGELMREVQDAASSAPPPREYNVETAA